MLLKLNKKLILFCSSDSPFWAEYFPHVTRLEIKRVLGISPTTMTNWEGGAGADPRKLREMFIDAKHALSKKGTTEEKPRTEERLERIEAALLNDSVSVYSFAELLGYSLSDSQKVIDQEIYKRMPVFRDIYYEDTNRDMGRADRDFQVFGGVYSVYIERGTDTIRALLRVRYVLALNGIRAIRAKFNVPKYVSILGKERPYFEYDGFLSVKPHNVFWTFEERDSLVADFFYMITERADVEADTKVFKGEYLTTKRSRDSTILSGRVFMVKEQVDEKDHHDFMHSDGELLENQSYDGLIRSFTGD